MLRNHGRLSPRGLPTSPISRSRSRLGGRVLPPSPLRGAKKTWTMRCVLLKRWRRCQISLHGSSILWCSSATKHSFEWTSVLQYRRINSSSGKNIVEELPQEYKTSKLALPLAWFSPHIRYMVRGRCNLPRHGTSTVQYHFAPSPHLRGWGLDHAIPGAPVLPVY